MNDNHIKRLFSSLDAGEAFKVGFLLMPDFSLLAFSAAIEPLRVANRLSNKKLFEWVVATDGRDNIIASSGVEITASADIETLKTCRMIFVCGGLDIQQHTKKESINILRLMERKGATIGAICTGTYVLAKAGLLNGYRCTIHWENYDGLIEDFPDLDITDDLFEIDHDRITCSGGTASLDMMLYIIAKAHGTGLATAVSEQFIHASIREPHNHQRMELRTRIGVSHPKLLSVVAEMEANLEEPLPQTEIARRTTLSTRQLERLFRKYLNTTPTRYYLNLRLVRARHLLKQTSMSILSIALACGFVSASHFSKCYREAYGCTPRAERNID